MMSKRNNWLPDAHANSADIAAAMAEMAEISQILGNVYREKAFSRAAKIFRSSQIPPAISISKLDSLLNIPGIGPGIIARVEEFITTGGIAEIVEIKKSPRYKAFVELTKILGVGPKTAAVWIDLGVYNLGDLRKMVGARKIVLTKQQELGLRWYSDLSKRIPRDEVVSISTRIQKLLLRAFGASADDIVVAGSYRRGLPTSGDIDILVRGEYDMGKFIDLLHRQPEFVDTIYTGSERCTFLWNNGTVRQVDILLRPENAWGAALVYFTGDAQYAKSMRSHAKKLGYRLNQNGLYKVQGRVKLGKQIPIKTEEDVFRILGLKYTPPNARSGEVKIDI